MNPDPYRSSQDTADHGSDCRTGIEHGGIASDVNGAVLLGRYFGHEIESGGGNSSAYQTAPSLYQGYGDHVILVGGKYPTQREYRQSGAADQKDGA